MKSLSLSRYGSLEHLRLAERPEPTPDRGQVRIKVQATSLNPADYKVATGEVKFLHGRRFPLTLGYDFSGVIDAIGPEVSTYKPGDEVFGFLPYGPFNNQGAFAEKVVAEVSCIARKPKDVPHAQAAAAATSGLTAIQSLRDLGKLKPGGRVLITGVSGGVGSIAVGVASRLDAGEIVAIGSGPGLQLAHKLGAQKVIDRKNQDVFAFTDGSFDVIFDAAAAYRWSQWNRHLRPGGAFVSTLPSAGLIADKFKSLVSSSRVTFVNVKCRAADLELLGKWMSQGLAVPLDSTVPLEQVPQALAKLGKGAVLGKVAVTV
ncbi:MAG TPA: NAD(P)-dependent alcohol dehydrogenase [Bdellovibrionota bacterium]|jgi:NADPH:quinone reductase-like Zn-dependent oxidoreductase|nr:NAD(P)-dependent alcohol dehydrogenase [Bdellovibrionota bacterium]